MNVFGIVVLFLLVLHQVNCGLVSTVNDLTRSSSKLLRADHAHDGEAETPREYPRTRRSVSSSNSSSIPIPKVEVIDLSDDHTTIQLDWSGKDSSDTMVILGIQSGKSSSLHVSHDYGVSFTMVTLNLTHNQTAQVDYFVKGPITYQLYVMVDSTHDALFISTNDCYNFTKRLVMFTPTYVDFHPTQETMIVLDVHTGIVHTSTDLGVTWHNSSTSFPGRRIRDAIWNPFKNDSVYLIVQQSNNQHLSDVYEVNTNLSNANLTQSDVLEFSISDDYMFAVKDHPSDSESLVLMVSYKQKPFRQARFPQSSEGQRLTEKSYYIADTSEQQVFVAVYHRSNLSNLYISEEEGISYSLSLDNVLFDDPVLSNNYYSNLRSLPSYKVIDFHKVGGLKGAYIASQINSDNQLESFITFDKGGVWQHVVPPSHNADGHPVRCEWPDCSLHLASQFSLSRYYVSPIYTQESTPGIIMASGFLGTSLISATYYYNLYVSNTSGATWTEALHGRHFYQFGDFGSVLVAVKQDFGSGIDYFEYSLDEGATWYRHQFHNSTTFRTYGMLTEPGEATTVFGIYGADTSKRSHDWMVIRIDFSEILSQRCTKEDYYKWSPSDNLIDNECTLGEKEIFERKIANHLCLNGGEYERYINKSVCPCTREDYECDFGFEEDDGNAVCLPSDQYDVHWGIPYPCVAGSTYTVSLGYRKIIGDKCVGGEEIDFLPRNYTCPNVKDSVQLYNNYNSSRKKPIVIGVGETVNFTASSIYSRSDVTFIWYSSSENYSINTTETTKNYTFNKAGLFFVTVGILSNTSSVIDFNTVKVYDHLTTDGIMLHVSNDKPLLGEEITVTAFLSDNDKLIYGDVRFLWYVHDQLQDNHLQVIKVKFNTTQSHRFAVTVINEVSKATKDGSVNVIDIMSHGFKVAVLGTSAVQLSWDYSEGWQHIMSYHIYYKAAQSETDLKILADLSPSVTSYLTTTLNPGTEYQFQLMASIGNMTQPASDTVSITTEPIVPGSPQNVQVSISEDQQYYNITWDPVNTTNLLFYQVLTYKEQDLGNEIVAELTEIPDGANYHTALYDSSQLYMFQVIAVVQNNAGRKFTSKPSSFVYTYVNNYKPYPPRNIDSYVINSTCVRLMWIAPLNPNTNTLQEVDSYAVEVSRSDGFKLVDSTSDTQIIRCGLSADTEYSYKVKSVVGPNYSDYVRSTFRTFSYVPEAPSTVVVEPLSDTSIKVSWKPPATYVNNFIKGYTLQDDSHSIDIELASFQYSITLYGLMAYEQYNFIVSVVYTSGVQYGAHAMTGTTKQGIPDAAICQNISSIGSTNATLLWMPPTRLNGELKQYEVVLHDPLGEIIPHYFTTNNSLSITLLRPSTSYTFSVRAHNGEGVGPYCNQPFTFTTNSSSGSTVELEITFQYSLVHVYSMNDQAKMFIEELISAISVVSDVDKNVFTGPHLSHNTSTVTVQVVILSINGISPDVVASKLIQDRAKIIVFEQTAYSVSTVDPPKGQSSDHQSNQENQSNKDDNQWLLITCVFISIAFNILFIIIIGFVFKRIRTLTRSNQQLVTRGGLHYNRINDRMDIDEVNINTNDDDSDTSNSSSPSPVNGNNNDDEPMIEL